MNAQQKFKIALVIAGMTKLELASQLGISYATLHRRITGRTQWRECEIQAVERILDTPRTELQGEVV